MSGNRLKLVFVAGVVVASAACGDVTVDGTFGGRSLDVTGTGVGWLDETEYVADSGGGTPQLEDRPTDAVLLHLMFTQAAFDPTVDFRTLPAGERATIDDDIARGDRLFVDISRGNVIRPGDKKIALVKNDGSLPPEVLPFIAKVAVLFGDPAIDAADRYPDRAPRLGSDLTATLSVDETAPELVGTLAITAKKADTDKDGFLAGTVKVHFGFELLPERLAECNFSPGGAGIVDPCTLN